MRTRIALVAIAPIAIITTTVLMQAATVQSARGAAAMPSGASISTVSHQPAGQRVSNLAAPARTPVGSSLLLDLNAGLLAHAAISKAQAAAPTPPAVPVPVSPAPAAPTGPVDTVTPAQRAAWERVAMCEESGNWSADSSRFSGGLGITRSNWDSYGGREFAPEGAMATEDQQIMVAERIQPVAPDQYGCRGW